MSNEKLSVKEFMKGMVDAGIAGGSAILTFSPVASQALTDVISKFGGNLDVNTFRCGAAAVGVAALIKCGSKIIKDASETNVGESLGSYTHGVLTALSASIFTGGAVNGSYETLAATFPFLPTAVASAGIGTAKIIGEKIKNKQDYGY